MPGGRPWPRISIVTPSLNQGRYLEETILSVRHQGYPDVEHIIVDGGSTDETPAILRRYRDTLAHVMIGSDGGQSDAINRGMRLATGEILTWLNSDDMLAPGALAGVALAFAMSGADLVAGACLIWRDGRLADVHLTSCPPGPLPLHELLDVEGRWLAGRFFYQPEVMFTRAIWERAGAHVRTDLYYSMDYELWLRMAHVGARLHVIGRPVALFRAHAQQKTAGTFAGGYRAELPRVREAFLARTGLAAPASLPAGSRGQLRVVMVNDLGYAFGAGIAHRRIAEAFQAAGHRVFALAAGSPQETNPSAPRPDMARLMARLERLRPDLVVVGNLHGADLDADVLYLLARRYPTAYVLHDLWLLTGRCAYPGRCRRYLERCDHLCSCPPGYPHLPAEQVRSAWERKRAVLRACPGLVLWANSRWTMERAVEALSAPGACAGPAPGTICYGLDLETFRPRDRDTCRDLLGLPRDRFIIMASSVSVMDPRKGIGHLAAALKSLALEDTLVVCTGRLGPGERPPFEPVCSVGFVSDPQRLACLYAAADIFVGPSLEEAFGQVFMEAAACGTPSVGYATGGVPEAIADGVSGLVVRPPQPRPLADAIATLHAHPRLRRDLGVWGRLWAENQWGYRSLYLRIHWAMEAQGLTARLGLSPRIRWAAASPSAPEPALIGSEEASWRALENFGPWEGPDPQRNLRRGRWAYGPVARFAVTAAETGPARLLLACRTPHQGQRVRLVHNGRSLGERDVPGHASPHDDYVLSFNVHLRAGENAFELHCWRWSRGPRPLAVMITWLSCVPG